MNIPRLLLPALLLILSGCAFGRAQDASDAKAQMIGMSKEAVFTCMGPPLDKNTEGNTEIWSYYSGNGSADSNKVKLGQGTAATGNSSVTFGSKSKSFCNINIVIRKNRVSAVNYSGPTGGYLTPDEQCGYAVSNCLNP